MAVYLKKPDEILIMREAGRIVARCHEAVRAAIKPGVSTYELDQIAARVLNQHNARPAFLGYPPNGKHPFPASITASINDELVHGIPSKDRVLKEGDIISIDVGSIYQGFVGDAAFSVGVGKISREAQRLLDVTEKALYEGIKQACAGKSTSDIGRSIQRFVAKHGYDVAREYTGHGVGRNMHEEPSVPNWWPRRKTRGFRPVKLQAGMTLAIEPMVVQGRADLETLDDHWTVVTKDGSLCAHHEHSVAITEGEPIILTLP
jgi:methionyl aminopeptidase